MSSRKKIMVPVVALFATAGTLALTTAVLLTAGVVSVPVAGAAPADITADTPGDSLRVSSPDAEERSIGSRVVTTAEPLTLDPVARVQAPLPAPRPAPAPRRAPVAAPAASAPAPAAPAPSRSGDDGAWQSARASWYGPGFYGRTTASGAVLTEGMMNVAHRTLPFGTQIQFQYNGRTATAVVNDRGPHIAGREFDLGPGTARTLGFSGVGTVQYRILGR